MTLNQLRFSFEDPRPQSLGISAGRWLVLRRTGQRAAAMSASALVAIADISGPTPQSRADLTEYSCQVPGTSLRVTSQRSSNCIGCT